MSKLIPTTNNGINPMRVKQMVFSDMKELNAFIDETISERTAGTLEVVNGRPDHIISIQQRGPRDYNLFYWSRE